MLGDSKTSPGSDSMFPDALCLVAFVANVSESLKCDEGYMKRSALWLPTKE